MTQGWIKLHRRIRDHWLWQTPERLRAWIDLLFMANYEDREELVGGKVVVIVRGDLWTNERKLAERWGRSRRWVRIFLELLQQSEMITRSGPTLGPTGGTIISICNYEKYQSTEGLNVEDGAHDGAQAGPKLGPPYKEERSEEEPYLLPEFEPSKEAKKFVKACREIRRVRIGVKGEDSTRPVPADLGETFDQHAKAKWPQVMDWKMEIKNFREYWCTPDTQKKPRTFDYWLRFTKWLNRAVTGHGNRRPSGQLDPSGRRQRLLDEFEEA